MKIPKKDGTLRVLHNPDSLLRAYQYRTLTTILNKLDIPDYIHAFEKRKSIPEMASIHTGKHLVLSIDLKDFFHSIKQARIKDTLLSLDIGESAAKSLSELCTYKAFMPQGALTSPKLANIITATSFGPLVKEYCDNKNLVVSIYADDITMSTNDTTLSAKEVLTDIMNLVKGTGFRINFKKTKVMYKSNRQYVCGVVVNQKTNLIKKERYRLRAMVHNVTVNGLQEEADKAGKTPDQYASYLRGKVNWFKQLNPELGNKMALKLSTYLKGLQDPSLIEEIETSESPNLEFGGVKPEEIPWDPV